MVAAWIRAETGVGPSIASGSHVWSGIWADLATAPPSSARARRVTVVSESSPDSAASNTGPKSRLPTWAITRKKPSAMIASPRAFMTNAFFAASTAEVRSWWNPISRYEARPTRPQPTRSISRFPPWTSRSIEKTKNAM